VFWSDLASAYYAKDTLVRLEKLKIEYVPKEENPSNVLTGTADRKFLGELEKKGLLVYSNNYRPKM
jgi:hypothetical protein